MHNIVKQDQKQVRQAHKRVIYGAPEGHDARLIAEMAQEAMPVDRVHVHIALDDARISALEELLAFFAPHVRVLSFPAWDCLPYDRVSPHADIIAQRVACLTQLMAWEHEKERVPRVLLTSVNASLQRVMPQYVLRESSFSAVKGGHLNLEDLQLFLSQNGYIRNETVRDVGEYAIRGGIIDLFPAGHEKPVRLDLFGDEIESIKVFDPLTQRTESSVGSFSLQPATEFFMDEHSISRFRAAYREQFGAVRGDDPLYQAVGEGRRYNGIEHWLPLFYERMDTIFDYVPDASVSLDMHGQDSYRERVDQVKDFYQARKTLQQAKGNDLQGAVYNPVPIDSLYMSDAQWQGLTGEGYALSNFGAQEGGLGEGSRDAGARKGRDFADLRALPDGDVLGGALDHIASLKGQGKKVMIACYSEGSKQRLEGMLEKITASDKFLVCETAEEIKKFKSNSIGVAILGLEHGFDAPDLAVLTEQDILGDRLTRKAKKSRKADNFLREVSALDEGDLVVHIDHGIGRFIELETLSAAGTVYDCLKIEYADGDKLYVPVLNLEVLSRFGSDEGTVQLDKLGGAGWQARKAKAKKNLMEMAEGLLKTAAARQLNKADPLHLGDGLYEEFAARFPYQETEDQDRAIAEVIEDMAGGYAMDRLVCGDVGFGKTEVAIRAAYVAAMSGVQVALVVPTTLLSRQHYANFCKRFEGTGIRIGQLSRLVAAKDAAKVRDGLKDGSIQIAIGTHALFAKSVKFDNLGLVIVDEEQRFGVKQKERLKEIKSNVHVLTLTATPIPRTLQMSLSGVKEMSLITTPPVDRLAIRTFVMPLDRVVIRDALLREFYRGGQSFYVVPRIKDINDISEMLKELVPEVKFIEAHGQLTATELEDRMSAFYDRQYDVLLATNIIESGIDIPNANTMIVHRADMFGLAQLYQIRGRIGRSKVRAYAYLTYKLGAKLNPQAQKRLEVMETLDTLGSGFQLASHDMDIRGAGNLLGDKQSGHIKEIGVELYQQMLEEAIAFARAGGGDIDEIEETGWSPQIAIGISVLIPETYVEDLSVRMSLYRRLNELVTQTDIEGFAAELIDRFGDLPDEVQNLLDVLAIKQLCKKANIEKIDAGPKGAMIQFYKNTPPDVGALMGWIAQKRGAVKIKPDQRLSILKDWGKVPVRVKGVQNLLKEIAALF